MLYAPLSTSSAVEYRPSGLENQLPMDPKLLACNISPFLNPISAFSAVQSRLLLSSTGQADPTGTILSSSESGLAGSSDVSNNLSHSSSLSSSLASLHSVASHGKLSGTSLSSPLNQQRPTSRSSVWLKLRVCPAWLAAQLPQCTKLPSSVSEPSDFSPTTWNVSSGNETSSLSTFNSTSCSLYPDSCPYAHPTPNVRVDAGHVTVCYDFLKRKNCKHSSCKYYHPLPHQIEDILKRGDEQKKLMENQQRLLESKIPPHLTMQPSQPSHNGLSTTICGPGLIWPPVSAYGAYGQPLPASFNPMAAVSSQFASSTDTSTFNPGALLAAAAALQQQQQSSSQVTCTPNLLSSSGVPKSTITNVNSGTSTPATQTSSTISSLLTSSTKAAENSHFTTASALLNEQSQTVAPAVSHALGLVNSTLNARCSITSSVALEVGASSTSTTSSAVALPSIAQFGLPVMMSVSVPNNISSSTNTTAPSTVSPVVVRVGMKREANSISSDACGVGLDLHPWYPSKRVARSSDYATEKCMDSESSDAHSTRNGTGSEEVKCEADLTPGCSDASSLLPAGLALPSYCGAISNQDMTSGFSNFINPVNLYGIAFPTQPTVVSSYLPAQHLAYPSAYGTQGAPDAANQATLITFNNWLAQQQQHQPQHTPSGAQHFLPTQLPLIHAPNSNAALAALASLQQNAQSSPSDLSGTAQPMSLAIQNQQAALLSLIIRAQQSQFAAAQMAAAVQASNTAGLLQHGSLSRASAMGALQNQCFLDPTYSFQALAGLCPTQLLPTIPCVQNPITNVAYVNDKGHLLESLPICRDFKAGKCHRNSECRYVHLVDENVEVNQGRVVVCRDAAKGRCTRMPCKYFHVPLLAISANRSIALNSALATAGAPTNQ